MSYAAEISARRARIRAALDAADARDAAPWPEIGRRLAELDQIYGDEATAATAHPLGADAARTALALFLLDRCESLLQAPSKAATAGAIDSLVVPSLGATWARRLCSVVLFAGAGYRRYIPAGYDVPTFREMLYAHAPGPLARLIERLLPRTRRAWEWIPPPAPELILFDESDHAAEKARKAPQLNQEAA